MLQKYHSAPCSVNSHSNFYHQENTYIILTELLHNATPATKHMIHIVRQWQDCLLAINHFPGYNRSRENYYGAFYEHNRNGHTVEQGNLFYCRVQSPIV